MASWRDAPEVGGTPARTPSWASAPLAEEARPPSVARPNRSVAEQAIRVPVQAAAGVNDRLAEVVGAPFDLINRGLGAVGLPQGPFGTESIRRGIRSFTGEPPKREGALEELAYGGGSGLVDAATVLAPAAAVSRVAQAGGLAQRSAAALSTLPELQVAGGVAGGAVSEATDNPLLGTAAALAVPLGVAGAARAITPLPGNLSPQRAALVAAAERENIPLSVGQATGNPFITKVEQRLRQMPQTSGPAGEFEQAQTRAFNAAVLRRSGTAADNAGPDIINPERNRIGGTIGAIANRNTLDVTPALEGRLQQIEDSLRFIPAETAEPVRARIDQLRGMMIQPPAPPPGSVLPAGAVGPTPTIPGASYRMMDSALGRNIRNTQDGDRRAALADLRETLRNAMDSSISPADAAEWQQARREYANLMVTAKAAGGAGAQAAEGNVSPLALRSAVDQSTGGGYAWGRGDLNELARLGQGVLRPPSDSGTPAGMAVNALLSGSGNIGNTGMGAIIGSAMGSPVLGAMAGAAYSSVAPRVVQSALMSPALQGYLRNQLIAQQGRVAIRSARNNILLQQGIGNLTD